MSDFNDFSGHLPSNIDQNFQSQWKQIQSAWAHQRIPQSMLFVGSFDRPFLDFLKILTQLYLCKNEGSQPCFECIDCQMVANGEHPDVEWIKPEKIGGPIKIDQIRELQDYAYLTPQRTKYRLIVIESADRMNTSAANSLLKILEEPPQQTLFLLLAQQLSTLLPTVLSRCQIIRFASHDNQSMTHPLQLAEYYPEGSAQAMIVKQSEFILDGLIAVMKKNVHPSSVASQWGQFDLGILLWFLYLIFAQIQVIQINTSVDPSTVLPQLNYLKTALKPGMIFSLIDRINTLQRKLSHNMNINQTLALEDLLFALESDSSTFS
ncbi:DNA polymerase III subunit delta' [Fluoribacter dumoffii]|uniref:DNA polymerase III subunit delta' n=1 Tax=Fluoribacter dumoffii TaxID=463 RepID=A0A377G9V4_9GAMM|nr:DNA polymerase III subunit delta' C-terminal domain-containing protein [Fluoribacter dumoffii]KTC88999.1 DNA polymerase III, delta' subunit [Fluoribacter dumoffii NY 23]MCW8385789.1 DNA polymerase III subunit delta' [Fluoribacter dumoffii]MCW8495916.1 DNA polymerase III subunit delta' [Fluoribacter dumoffii]STO21597.1 DNA polymerase III subunit delta' [Fluoribacter dumoffii]